MTNIFLRALVENESSDALRAIVTATPEIAASLGIDDTKNANFLLLLTRNASRRDDFGNLPLHNACLFNLPLEVIDCITKTHREALTTKNEQEATPLHYACKTDDPRVGVVNYLVGRGPKASGMEDIFHMTPIHYLIERLQHFPPDTIPHMIALHPDATRVPDSTGNYVLRYACEAYKSFANNHGSAVLDILIDVVKNSPPEAFHRIVESNQSVYDLAARVGDREELGFLVSAMDDAVRSSLGDSATRLRPDFPELVKDGAIKNFLLGITLLTKRGRSDTTNKVRDVRVLGSLLDHPDCIFLHCRESVQGLFCLPPANEFP
jgi:hypothetical protein